MLQAEPLAQETPIQSDSCETAGADLRKNIDSNPHTLDHSRSHQHHKLRSHCMHSKSNCKHIAQHTRPHPPNNQLLTYSAQLSSCRSNCDCRAMSTASAPHA